jgi:hypothetical protein
MANESAITAESVASILESARVQRQSGRLLVGQYARGRFQEGEIYLQDGYPVYARLGQMFGQEALNQLFSWRNVRLSLILDEPRDNTPLPETAIDTGGGAASFPAPQVDRDPQDIPPQLRPPASTGNGRVPGPGGLIPRRRQPERDVLSLPLTRPQRFVYMLVDGQRTITDIARCTGKTVQEVDLILGALRAQGLVTV